MTLRKQHFPDPVLKDHIAKASAEAGLDASYVVPSMWVDGVLFNKPRTKSLEVCCINFPGIGSDIRIPLFVCFKDCLTPDTWHDLMSVHRRRQIGKRLPHALLVRDWSACESQFNLPGWNETSGCCLRRGMDLSRVHETGSSAPWKSPERRLSHLDNIQRMRSKGWATPSSAYLSSKLSCAP